jgi:hypothetical protein
MTPQTQIFQSYMKALFDMSTKYVVVYSSNIAGWHGAGDRFWMAPVVSFCCYIVCLFVGGASKAGEVRTVSTCVKAERNLMYLEAKLSEPSPGGARAPPRRHRVR